MCDASFLAVEEGPKWTGGKGKDSPGKREGRSGEIEAHPGGEWGKIGELHNYVWGGGGDKGKFCSASARRGKNDLVNRTSRCPSTDRKETKK